MRVLILSLSVLLVPCVWVSDYASAADISSPLHLSFGIATIATDLVMYQLPLVPERAEAASLIIPTHFSPVARSLPGLWHESVAASSGTCSLLGTSWCLALQSDSPTPEVLGVSHSVDVEMVPTPTQTQVLPSIVSKNLQPKIPSTTNQLPASSRQQ